MKIETRLGASWALGLATVVVGTLAAHCWISRFSLAEMHALASSGEVAAVNRVIVNCPRPAIVVIGNSRARESVICPILSQELGLPDGAVRNYATSGANAETTCALVRLMITKDKLPPIVIWPVSPRELTWTGSPSGYFAPLSWPTRRTVFEYGGFDTWLRFIAARNLRVGWLHDVTAAPTSAAPSLGDKTDAQTRNERHFRTDREPAFSRTSVSAGELARLMKESEMGGCVTLDSNCCDYAAETMAELRAAGCRVILAEVPISRGFRNAYPSGVYLDFLELFFQLGRRRGTVFLELPGGEERFTDADMADATHCNWTGAVRFTRRLISPVRDAMAAPRGKAP